jgi:hypothetical protein
VCVTPKTQAISLCANALQDQLTPLERFRKTKSKKGNAGEFMGLLMSLTKRW